MREHVTTCSPRPDKTTEIRIGIGNRQSLEQRIAALGADRPVAAILDEAIAERYPELISPNWNVFRMPSGEAAKSFGALEQVLRQMAERGLDRQTIVVAIGGGATGDAAGLAASLYLRGVELVQVPTTLLAMLDSSVGGKTAVNIPEGKNLVGTFWPPALMLADLEFVQTLPREHLMSGLGEALKMGIGFSAELFELLEREADAILGGDLSQLARVVTLAVSAKIDTVTEDPFETTGRRRCLNLGHTLAHALEAMSDYTMLHGLAVAQGLHFAIQVAVARGVLADDAAERCRALLASYGYADEPLPERTVLRRFFARDKKMQDGLLHFVLPTDVGACRTFPLPPTEL